MNLAFGGIFLFKRMNKLAIELPKSPYADVNAAAAVQTLLCGRFGEMSLLNNAMFQSFNFRGKKKFKPFYDLILSITAEELSHVELIAHTTDLCLSGATLADIPNIAHLGEPMGKALSGEYVFNSGNLILDLLHNFFLECGARTHKIRFYEMTEHPAARELAGYLIVRGGVHVLAYAKALEIATGVDMTRLSPIPNLDNRAFETACKYEEQGVHRVLYTFSEQDYRDISLIWKGSHPEDGKPLKVVVGFPEGAPVPELGELEEELTHGISPEDYIEIVHRLQNAANLN